MTKNKVKRIFKEYQKNKEILSKYYKYGTIKEKEANYLSKNNYDIDKIARMVNLRDLLYLQLDDYEKKIMDLRYNEKLSVFDVVDKLYVSESTYYRQFKKIIIKLEDYISSFEELFKL